MSYKINDCHAEEITRVVDGVHDLVEIYGDEILKNNSKQIKMLEGIYSVVNKINIPIVPDSGHLKLPKKNTLEEQIKEKELLKKQKEKELSKYISKVSNTSKLEQFELEEQAKKIELDLQIKKELLKKQKEDELLKLKLQKQQEEEARLHRILKMFSSKNTTVFNCGYIYRSTCGMNNIRNSTHEFRGMGSKQYVLTIELLKNIKSENKEVIKQKYNTLTDNYIWIKKYVMNEGFVSFVLEMNIDDMITTDLKTIENEEKSLFEHFHGNYCFCHRVTENIRHKKQKVSLLTRIKNKTLKTKEYYIVNNDEFCKDYEINDMKLNIPQSAEQQWSIQWSILNYWVKSKQAKFDELIINIHNIVGNIYGSGPNWYRHDYFNQNGSSDCGCGDVLQLYNNYVIRQTQRGHVTEHFHEHSDIVNDYIPEYFEPLMSFSKIIIDMIDFIQNE